MLFLPIPVLGQPPQALLLSQCCDLGLFYFLSLANLMGLEVYCIYQRRGSTGTGFQGGGCCYSSHKKQSGLFFLLF